MTKMLPKLKLRRNRLLLLLLPILLSFGAKAQCDWPGQFSIDYYTACPGTHLTATPCWPGTHYWSSDDASIATVDASGNIYTVAAGTVYIYHDIVYTVTRSDGSTYTDFTTGWHEITVYPAADAGTISGDSALCVGATTRFISSGDPSIAWSSSATGVATVDPGGLVTGVAAGTAIITYTANRCGLDTAIKAITIVAAPVRPVVDTTSTCGSGITLTAGSGATRNRWYSYNWGYNIDTAIVSATTTGWYVCISNYGICNVVDSHFVNIIHFPIANNDTTICAGQSVLLSVARPDTTSTSLFRGHKYDVITFEYNISWDSAKADAIRRGGHLVTFSSAAEDSFVAAMVMAAAHPFTAWIGLFQNRASSSYREPAGGWEWVTGEPFTFVNWSAGEPNNSSYSGYEDVAQMYPSGPWNDWSINENHYIIEYDSLAPPTITWSTGATASSIAVTPTVSTNYILTTTLNGASCADTVRVTVNPLPVAGTISGATSVCTGTTTTLSSSVTGGSWSTSNAAVASVNSSTGVVTGIAAGSATISYSVTGSCGTNVATQAVTVNPTPLAGTISGTTTVCAASSTSLSSTVSGGSWTSSNAAVASVNTRGLVTGVAAGAANIVYTYTNSCGTDAATTAVTVLALPVAGTISGTSTVCQGATTLLSASVTGGSWSTSTAAVASVSTSGIVYGVAAGSAAVAYTVTNSCGTAYATRTIAVSPLPAAGAISGLATLCVAGTTTYTASGTTGGTWSSVPTSRASITSGGVLRGVAGGNDTVYYTITTGCGTSTASKVVVIETTPGSPGTLSTVTGLNVGETAIIASSVAGGTWSVTNTTLATIAPTGIITARAVGTDTVKYTVVYACGSVSAIRPFNVTGLTAAGTISGPSSVCVGSTITLSSTVTGGTWTSSFGSVASVTSTGVVRGVAIGTIAITYTVGSLRSTRAITVSNGTVSAIAGATSICPGTNTVLTNPTAGGTWSNMSPSIGTINTTSGQYFGNNSGNDSVYYTIATGCGTRIARRGMVVTSAPSLLAISPISGNGCLGTNTLLQNATVGVTGIWSFSNPTLASITVVATPTVTVVGGTAGIDTLKYTVTGTCGLVSVASRPITFTGLPAVGAGTTRSMIIGTSTTLTNTVSGGAWSTVYPTIASVNPTTGAVRARAAGLDTIKYRTTNICGTSTAIYLVTVTASKPGSTEMTEASANDIKVYPNPSGGILTIELTGNYGTTGHTIRVSNAVGRLVMEQQEATDKFNIDLSNQPSGMYLLHIVTGSQVHEVKVVKE